MASVRLFGARGRTSAAGNPALAPCCSVGDSYLRGHRSGRNHLPRLEPRFRLPVRRRRYRPVLPDLHQRRSGRIHVFASRSAWDAPRSPGFRHSGTERLLSLRVSIACTARQLSRSRCRDQTSFGSRIGPPHPANDQLSCSRPALRHGGEPASRVGAAMTGISHTRSKTQLSNRFGEGLNSKDKVFSTVSIPSNSRKHRFCPRHEV